MTPAVNPTPLVFIAAHLADRIVTYQRAYQATERDLSYLIERELDKYVADGSIRVAKERPE